MHQGSLRTLQVLTAQIDSHLERNSIYSSLGSSSSEVNDKPWKLDKSNLAQGFGVFATRDIQVGEIVFQDVPIITGPRSTTNPRRQDQFCVSCYTINEHASFIAACPNGCGLPLCHQREQCQTSSNVDHRPVCQLLRKWQHQSTTSTGGPVAHSQDLLVRCLTPIQALFLQPEELQLLALLKANKRLVHETCEIDELATHFQLDGDLRGFLRWVCCILNTNAFQIDLHPLHIPRSSGESNSNADWTIRGLYPLGGLLNHSCVPNVTYTFDSINTHRMTVTATSLIRSGTELFISYCPLLWGTQVRRFHLYRTKAFICKCERCRDPTEFGTFMGAILCAECDGMGALIDTAPEHHLLAKHLQCEKCSRRKSTAEISATVSMLGAVLQTFTDDDDDDNIDVMLNFMQKISGVVVVESNEILVKLKLRIIGVLQRTANKSSSSATNCARC